MRLLTFVKSQMTVLHLLLVCLSGVVWCALWLLNRAIMSSQYTSGIDLIYLPAGFRLIIVLIFGFWGALGIFLFNPLMFLHEFGSGSIVELLSNSFIAGFAPYFVAAAFCRLAGIPSSLAGLRPMHLPLLALAVSIVTPLLFNIQFLATGRHSIEELPRNVLAMAMGDFLGCFLVLTLVYATLKVIRPLLA